jgi:hypothetical protein
LDVGVKIVARDGRSLFVNVSAIDKDVIKMVSEIKIEDKASGV